MNPPSTVALSGLWIPIATPFTDRGELDETSLRRSAQNMLGAGAAGLVALGTTGEPATLSAAERRRVVEVCDTACANAGGGLIVGAGTNSTAGTIAEIEALTTGTSTVATLIVAPYYTRPSSDAIVEHFGIVADASPLPVVIYNIPYRTGRGLNGSELLTAGAHPNIIGLKQAVGALDGDTLTVLAAERDEFAILAGDDAFITPTILMGGSGAIAAAAHLCTEQFVAMVNAAESCDIERAVALAGALLPVVVAGFAEPSPAVWKGALAAMGVITSPTVRRPMTSASPAAIDRLLQAADAAVAI